MNKTERFCEKCGADWQGEKIEDPTPFNSPHKFKIYDDMPFPSNYEAFEADVKDGRWNDDPRLETHFSRKIGIYCQNRDRIVSYKCPDCNTNEIRS